MQKLIGKGVILVIRKAEIATNENLSTSSLLAIQLFEHVSLFRSDQNTRGSVSLWNAVTK